MSDRGQVLIKQLVRLVTEEQLGENAFEEILMDNLQEQVKPFGIEIKYFGFTNILKSRTYRIINENNMVEAQISTPLQGKTVKFDVLLFNKNYSGIFSIKLSSDERLGSTKATILTEATDVYRKSKLLEHRLVQMLFRLKPPPDNQTVINCNNQLLEYIKGLRNDLGCVPFGNQISAYAK